MVSQDERLCVFMCLFSKPHQRVSLYVVKCQHFDTSDWHPDYKNRVVRYVLITRIAISLSLLRKIASWGARGSTSASTRVYAQSDEPATSGKSEQ